MVGMEGISVPLFKLKGTDLLRRHQGKEVVKIGEPTPLRGDRGDELVTGRKANNAMLFVLDSKASVAHVRRFPVF